MFYKQELNMEFIMFLFFSLFVFLQEPMNVKANDPIIDVLVKDLEGVTSKLSDTIDDNSFCFFLSTDCPVCLEALRVVPFVLKHHQLVFLFTESESIVRGFVADHQLDTYGQVLLVPETQLKSYRITKRPTLLAYRNGKLQVGYYGPLGLDDVKQIDKFYHKGTK